MRQLDSILSVSQTNNAAVGVSGMLLYSEPTFLQVLAGTRADGEGVYARIAADPRHGDLKRLVVEPIEPRGFGEWAMASVTISEEDLEGLIEVADLQSATASLATLDVERARGLLTASVLGRWRTGLSSKGRVARSA